MSKIVATVSPNTEILEGIDIGRINGSFGTKEEIARLATRIIKEMNVPVLLDLPRCRKKQRTNNLTDDDLIAVAKQTGISYLGLSYICKGEEIEEIRKKISGSDISLIAKIEAKEAEHNLNEIISASDGIMIDRGDLANAVGLERLPRLQKKIIEKCNKYGKMVIVATEMLTSMIHNTNPTKAEVLDIANAVSSGADYVMLSEETALGKHPLHVVKTMKKIIDEVSDRYKVIILSAGSGMGLGAITARHHVCLTDIGGKTILDLQLENLKRNGIYEEDIIIATGKGHHEIKEYLKNTDIHIIFNPWYETTNIMATIWLARHLIQNGFIVVYGDIIFESEVLKRILQNKHDIVLGVEKKSDLDEEDEKICAEKDLMVLHPDYKNLPEPKHKCIPYKDSYGEFIGIAKFNRQGSALLSKEMNTLIERNKINTYLVEAFESLVAKNFKLNIQDVSGLLWNDNDTIYDIERTKAIYKKIAKKDK